MTAILEMAFSVSRSNTRGTAFRRAYNKENNMNDVIQSPVKAGTSKSPIARAAASTHVAECEWLTPDANRISLWYTLEWELWCPADYFGRPSATDFSSIAFRLALDKNLHPSDCEIPDDVPKTMSGTVEASKEDVDKIFVDLADAGRLVEKIIDDHRYRPFGYNRQVNLSEPNVSRLLFKSCLNEVINVQAAE